MLCTTAGFPQQTGVVIGTTPGSANHRTLPQATPVPRPEPTCASPGISIPPGIQLPDLVVFRMMDSLVCLRHADGASEQLLQSGPWTELSPNGNDLAYWIPEQHALHHYSISDRKDTLLDTIPGATMSRIVWSRAGRTVLYQVFGNKDLYGIRTINLDTGARVLLPPTEGRFLYLPDADHVLVTAASGIRRLDLSTRKAEPVPGIDGEEFSVSAKGTWSAALTAKIEKTPSPAENTTSSDDDVDCTGAVYDLTARNNNSGQSRIVPFPEGSDSIHDFEFSPDERYVAVSFGAAACDYPGDKARIYLVALPDFSMRPISPAERLSVKVHWTPDSSGLLYSDYTDSNTPLKFFHLPTGKTFPVSNPQTNGPDEWLGWR